MRVKFRRIKDGTGEYDYSTDTASIDLNDDRNPAMTFIHESLHRFFHRIGVSLSAKKEEDLVLAVEKFIWGRLTTAQKKNVLKKVAKIGLARRKR